MAYIYEMERGRAGRSERASKPKISKQARELAVP